MSAITKSIYAMDDQDLLDIKNAVSLIIKCTKEITPAVFGTKASVLKTCDGLDNILTVLNRVVSKGSIKIPA